MTKKIVALLLCLAMVAGMTALVRADEVVEVKPDIREMDIANQNYTSVIHDNWTFRGLTKTWGEDVLTVEPIAGSADIEFRPYYSYNGATASVNTDATYVFESSNSDIVSVDANGFLTANDFGTADITVTFSDYNLSKTIEVNVPEKKPEVRELDIASQSYSNVFNGSWMFRGLEKTWGEDVFTIEPIAGSEIIDFRPYYSYNGSTASVNTDATYVYEWEWMAEDDINITLMGAFNANGDITLNGTSVAGNLAKKLNETINLSAGVWRTEKLVITKPNASDYWRVIFPDQQTKVSIRSFKAVVFTGNETYDDISIGSIADIQIGKTATMSVTGLKNGETVSKISNSKLSFSSSNSEIISVDENGILTAESGGTATITVTYADYLISKDIDVTVTGGEPAIQISSNVVDAGEYKGFQHSYVVYATVTNFENIINYGMKLKLADGSDQLMLPSGVNDSIVVEKLTTSEGRFAFKVFGKALDDNICTLTPYITTSTGTIDGNSSKKFGMGTIED